MKSVEDVVRRIYASEKWRFGIRNAEDTKQEIWVCVIEALPLLDANRGEDPFSFLRFLATKRLRRKLLKARRHAPAGASLEWELEETRTDEIVTQAERNAQIRWWLSRVKKHETRPYMAVAMVANGVLIDEAASAVYPERSEPRSRRRKLLEEVREYVGGAHAEWSNGTFAEI